MDERSRVWDLVFRSLFRTTPQRPLRAISSRSNSIPLHDVIIVGRQTGTERRVLLALLNVGGRWYVGHPNGGRAHWIRNIEASGAALVVQRDGARVPVRAVRLATGRERDSAIEAATHQPFPANLLYGAARRHVAAVGVYFRLDSMTTDAANGPTA